jgi:DNA replication initiation complex subunit (GINS family)
VGPFQQGNEYVVYQWVAAELSVAGVGHLREEDTLDSTKLAKVQWKERIQVAGQISELPTDFYPRLRLYLADLQSQLSKNPQKVQEYERVKSLALDIVNSRLRKIVTLSSSPMQPEQILNKLTAEERLVYMQLGKIVTQWRNDILEHQPQGP